MALSAFSLAAPVTAIDRSRRPAPMCAASLAHTLAGGLLPRRRRSARGGVDAPAAQRPGWRGGRRHARGADHLRLFDEQARQVRECGLRTRLLWREGRTGVNGRMHSPCFARLAVLAPLPASWPAGPAWQGCTGATWWWTRGTASRTPGQLMWGPTAVHLSFRLPVGLQ